MKNGAVASVELFEDEGIGIRVIAGGSWGFAGIDDLGAAGIEETARQYSAERSDRAPRRPHREGFGARQPHTGAPGACACARGCVPDLDRARSLRGLAR